MFRGFIRKSYLKDGIPYRPRESRIEEGREMATEPQRRSYRDEIARGGIDIAGAQNRFHRHYAGIITNILGLPYDVTYEIAQNIPYFKPLKEDYND